MYAVTYYENQQLVFSVLTKEVPAVGADIKIKGRKGKVANVTTVDEKNVHVQVTLEAVVNKQQAMADLAKKKKK